MDSNLRSCICGAEYCIPSIRLGPTLLTFADKEHKVVCLNCQVKSTKATTKSKAVENWNKQMTGEKWCGQRLRIWRTNQGLSQRELGDMTGVSPTTISHIEIGRRRNPDPRTREKIFETVGFEL